MRQPGSLLRDAPYCTGAVAPAGRSPGHMCVPRYRGWPLAHNAAAGAVALHAAVVWSGISDRPRPRHRISVWAALRWAASGRMQRSSSMQRNRGPPAQAHMHSHAANAHNHPRRMIRISLAKHVYVVLDPARFMPAVSRVSQNHGTRPRTSTWILRYSCTTALVSH